MRPSDSKGPGVQFQEVRGPKGAPVSTDRCDLNPFYPSITGKEGSMA